MHSAVLVSDMRPAAGGGFWRQLVARQPLLAWVAAAHLALVPFELGQMLVDHRLVTGENPWIKPIKFDLSIAIYVATMAWVIGALPAALKTSVARRIAVAMGIETAVIALQAARGVPSHFNVATPFDRVAFFLMGAAIVDNTWQIVRVLRAYFGRDTAHVAAPQRRATQLGLVSLLIAGLVGGYMIRHLGHAVGVADGGPGLPLLGWSTRGGDVRIAHFFGMHGIQLVLLAELALAALGVATLWRQRAVVLIFALHLLLTAALFGLAVHGVPLIRWEG